MLYGVFIDVHLVYLCYSIVYLGCLKSIPVMFFENFHYYVLLFFSLCFTLDFINFYYVMYLFIYFYLYYNTNFVNLKLEYCSSKLRIFFLRRWNIYSLNLELWLCSIKENILSLQNKCSLIKFYLNISIGDLILKDLL
jgi:hypothetical protein